MTNKIKNIGIVGGGKMGASIFNYLCSFDFKIIWYIRNNSEVAEKKHKRKLARSLKNQLITESKYQKLLENQTITNSLRDLNKNELVIECITEDLFTKETLVNQLFQILPKETIIASNSSSIRPELLCSTPEQTERIIGMHFFFPVEMKNIVELIPASVNNLKTINKAELFLSEINKFYLIQNGKQAFLLNRLMLHIQATAFNLHKNKKWSFAQIDSAVDKYLFPIGIFRMMDAIGLDTVYTSACNYISFEENKEHFSELILFLKDYISNNKLGTKTKTGFYNHQNTTDEEEILDKDKKQIATSLANSYFSNYNWITENNLCSRKDLTFSMNEYLDTDTDKWSDLK